MLTANNPFLKIFIIEIKYLKNTPIILIQICEEKIGNIAIKCVF